MLILLAPHLATSAQNEPDLFDGAVRNGNGRLLGREREVRQAATLQRWENPNVAAVERDDIR
jgi:hypothetical protein